MRKLLKLLATIVLVSLFGGAYAGEIKYVDALTLTHFGKLCKTSNPYNRVEVDDYPELTKSEARLLRYAAGESIMFETDSPEICVKATYGVTAVSTSIPVSAACGFNLYIERDDEWLWAASAGNNTGKDKDGNENLEKPINIIKNMDGKMKRCILYLPLFAELMTLEIGIDEDRTIKPMENPFRHKIAIFGSSFTHGSSATCAGQTYPAFLQRSTGLAFYSFGMSGNSKLQRVMGEILAGTDADAFVCDAFSNPDIETIGARMRPFLDEIRSKHPHTPVIFLRTIYRERRNFDTKVDQFERERIEYVEKLLAQIVKEYDDVYYISVSNQTGDDHLTSADGTHPSSWGYYRWANSIRKPLLKILAKYGIK